MRMWVFILVQNGTSIIPDSIITLQDPRPIHLAPYLGIKFEFANTLSLLVNTRNSKCEYTWSAQKTFVRWDFFYTDVEIRDLTKWAILRCGIKVSVWMAVHIYVNVWAGYYLIRAMFYHSAYQQGQKQARTHFFTDYSTKFGVYYSNIYLVLCTIDPTPRELSSLAAALYIVCRELAVYRINHSKKL